MTERGRGKDGKKARKGRVAGRGRKELADGGGELISEGVQRALYDGLRGVVAGAGNVVCYP